MYAIFECISQPCRFRFPGSLKEQPVSGYACPKCGEPTNEVARPNISDFTKLKDSVALAELPHLELFLDNTRSIYNVGSIFRTADGVGVRKLHLSGITATPDHRKFEKTALGTDLPWEYHINGVDAIKRLKGEGYQIWALEEAADSVDLFADKPQLSTTQPTVLVLGNEVLGVDPGILEMCDRTLMIPMRGEKKSLNVTIACGIAVYQLLNAITLSKSLTKDFK
ncbi:MAG: 23S rRNA (guanosine2251-2'-O)-methyltransferase [Cellvibrionaceae bacterium]|jgi:23S rRNA (guanosine2251-2'-O)-methyltransferase